MWIAIVSQPRYPEICVQIGSRNPLALVAAVREAMRQARLSPSEIRRFSDEALSSPGAGDLETVCRQWVTVQEARMLSEYPP